MNGKQKTALLIAIPIILAADWFLGPRGDAVVLGIAGIAIGAVLYGSLYFLRNK